MAGNTDEPGAGGDGGAQESSLLSGCRAAQDKAIVPAWFTLDWTTKGERPVIDLLMIVIGVIADTNGTWTAQQTNP